MIRGVKHILSVLFAIIATQYSFAQQSNTRGGNNITRDTALNRLMGVKMDTVMPDHKVMIIPFMPKMLMSEIDKDVNAKTHMTYSAITDAFRKQFDLAMYGAIRKNCVTISLLDGKQKSDSTLAYIYGSTTYSYDVVPGTTAEADSKSSGSKTNYIDKGQLKVPIDYSQRFMNVSFLNPKLLGDLSAKYNTDTYIFINEVDINNVDNNTDNLNDAAYKREITAHYSIVDKTGHYVSKGIATASFPYSEDDPKEIGEKYFSEVAKKIVKDYLQGLTMDKMQAQQKNQQSQNKGLFH